MSTNLPALSGTVVPAEDVGDTRAHAFFNVVRDLLHSSHAYQDEGSLEAARNAVNAYEKHQLSGPLSRQVSEDDRAPVEDVTQRAAPPTGAVVVPAAGPAIDYNKLAAAMFELQAQAQAQAAQQAATSAQPNEEGNPA